ncbi:MAG: VWA domain-containing protein, partial [Planctomycetales bacterium]|nr:VWA domain-containing protein [Planctomycetales bacterium]
GRAVAEAEKALKEGDWRVRAAATHVLLDSWKPEAIPVLIAHLGRCRGREARDVALALGRYAGKEMDPDPALWQSWWEANREKLDLPARPRGDTIGVRAPVKTEGTRAGPSYYGVLVETRRACFALDLSGSMRHPPPGGTKSGPSKAQAAAEELKKTLAALPDDAHVQVVTFSEDVATCFRDGCRRLSNEARGAIADFLAPRVLKPKDMTNLYEGIRAALSDEVDTLFLFTDGTGSVGEYAFSDRLHAKLGQENRVRRVQIHAFTYETRGVVLDSMRKLCDPTWGVVKTLP